MKVVILAGGLGTRLSEETDVKPKPMVEVGGMPILWHIMNHYSYYGHNDFIICLGYKGSLINNFFKMEKNKNYFKNLNLKLVNTGQKSFTGERIKRVKRHIKNDFFLFNFQ